MCTIISMEALKKIPTPVLVIIVLVGAVVFMMMSEPPRDACDVQLEVFMKAQAGRLSSLRGKVNSLWVRTAKQCQETKTLGGCTEFHNTLKLTLVDIQSAPVQCTTRLVSQEWLRKILTDSLILMVQIAWGEKPPEPGPQVYGWMEQSELAIFCKIQSNLQRVMTDEEWELFVRKSVSRLPQANELKFEESYWRSLFGVRCEAII